MDSQVSIEQRWGLESQVAGECCLKTLQCFLVVS